MLEILKTETLEAKRIIVDYEKKEIIVYTKEDKDYYLSFENLGNNFEENIIKILKIGNKYNG